MASTVLVYNTLKNLANKEQKGYITPDVFNNFAQAAQINVFNEFFTELVDAKRLSRQGFELGRDKSIRKQTLEDLSIFVTREVISQDFYKWHKPDNLAKIISIRVKDSGWEIGSYQATHEEYEMTPCELIYDVEKATQILGSNLSTPTVDFPVALITDKIEVFPSDITQIELTYYRLPGSKGAGAMSQYMGQIELGDSVDWPPHYSAQVLSTGYETPNYGSIRDFELPDRYVSELVAELAKMIGIRLRDSNILAYGSKEEAAE